MNADITELMLFFDELTDLTNEELKTYWFKFDRKDGIIITLVASLYDSHTCIVIKNNLGVDIASVSLENCSEIRILDNKKKCLEILHANGSQRCFLSLLGNLILEYKE